MSGREFTGIPLIDMAAITLEAQQAAGEMVVTNINYANKIAGRFAGTVLRQYLLCWGIDLRVNETLPTLRSEVIITEEAVSLGPVNVEIDGKDALVD